MRDMLAAAAAYDEVRARGGSPAEAVFAAAVVLDLPAAEALNELMDAGVVAFELYARPHNRKDPLGLRVARL